MNILKLILSALLFSRIGWCQISSKPGSSRTGYKIAVSAITSYKVSAFSATAKKANQKISSPQKSKPQVSTAARSQAEQRITPQKINPQVKSVTAVKPKVTVSTSKKSLQK